MSDTTPNIAGLITEATQLRFLNCVTISATVLVFYEYVLTLSTEVSEIWGSKFSGAQAIFFLTRYSLTVYTVLYCTKTLTTNTSEMLCRVLTINVSVWSVLTQVGLYGILTMRTYAIYQKNKSILVILGLTGGASVVIGMYFEVLEKPEVDGTVFGGICGVNPSPNPFRVELAATIISLLFDILVFALTFAKTIRHAIAMRKVGLGNGLGYFILRDGAIYFLAKLLIGVVGTTMFFVPASGVIGNWLGLVLSFSDPLTIVLINPLVLNLRRVSHIHEGNALTLDAIGTIQEPAFATNSFLGNLGAPLRVGPGDDDEFEDRKWNMRPKKTGLSTTMRSLKSPVVHPTSSRGRLLIFRRTTSPEFVMLCLHLLCILLLRCLLMQKEECG